MTFTQSVKTCLTTNYFNFSGCATRSEFWWFQLFQMCIILPLLCMSIIVYNGEEWTHIVDLLLIVALIFFAIPNLSATIRRLRDAGCTGWSVILPLFFPKIILIVILCEKSEIDIMQEEQS